MIKDIKTFLSSQKEFPILIVGYGVTGKAMCEFLENIHHEYIIFNDSEIDLPKNYNFLKAIVKTSEELSNIQIKALVPSPGISHSHSSYEFAKKNNIPILSELDIAESYLNYPLIIGVTGTNGKSTVVKLIYELLLNAGKRVSLNGNFGTPFINATFEDKKDIYIIEESSYQLELIQNLHHHIAICLNISDDHLDRYDSLKSYAKAKERILLNSNKNDFFIYNYDAPLCLKMVSHTKATPLPYSLVQIFENGSYFENGKATIKLNKQIFSFSTEKIKIKGLHNLENILASLNAALLIDNSSKALHSYQMTLNEFTGLAHRTEFIKNHHGIDFYDDSKATNVGAVIMALASFENNVILIAGGQGKGCDFSPLKGIVKGKVKDLVIFGESKDQLKDCLQDYCTIHSTNSMKEAVNTAIKLAQSGDTILLSPACASFDMYKNYKERGNDFQKWVHHYTKEDLT